MATKRKPVRKKSAPKKVPRPARAKTKPQAGRGKSRSTSSGVSKKAFDAMNERLDIMLPEVMFRIAALEHALVEKGFCTPEQLSAARQFIQEQEKS